MSRTVGKLLRSTFQPNYVNLRTSNRLSPGGLEKLAKIIRQKLGWHGVWEAGIWPDPSRKLGVGVVTAPRKLDGKRYTPQEA